MAQLRIEELAQDMLRQYRASEPPFILFLGKACLRDATAQFSDVIKQGVLKGFPEGSELFAKTLDSVSDWDAGLQKIAQLYPWKALRRMVLSIYRRVPIPSFYQDLAVMIRQGFFREILTTNFDTLLEQALEATGMRRGTDYRVINLQKPEQSSSGDASSVLLFKLHGDLGEQDFDLNPRSIDAALHLVKRELRQDLVVVGYEGETGPINDWFAKSGAGAVWWIAENTSPTQEILAQIGSSRDLHVLEGRYAAPEWFFQHLFQLVVKSQLDYADPPLLDADDAELFTPKELDPAASVRSEIEKTKNVLANLEHTHVSSGDIEAQIAYQKEWIAKMERELAAHEPPNALPKAAPHVVLDEILSSLKSDPEDRLRVTFEQQLNLLKDEWAKPRPSRHVANVALETAILLGEQFGDRLLPADSLDKLKSLSGSGIA